MPQTKTTNRRNAGPTAVPEFQIQQRAQTETQRIIDERTHSQRTATQKSSSGPSMPVPKPHVHPHIEPNIKPTLKIRKLRQPCPEPQAAVSELYHYVHEVDGTHTWRTRSQLEAMSEDGLRGTWHNDQGSGFIFFWRTR